MNGNTQRSDSTMANEGTLDRLEKRLEALESRIAYQEDWLDTLDQAVAGQERRLTQLERLSELLQLRLREQRQLLQAQGDGPGEGDYRLEDEIPPHY
ncbi:SlyX protein [Modicisalibacter xianhensis]|uniref:SlyX protein n=1 Tax=Modicisalibacter xianhensis TaxID=442341 RepID=A0A4R8FNJ1_9GAMM|nr:SlyX family protein [Halomonas xianhensis]TDX27849.1 SlyX protein [Halomonas xianhensis]